jgi:hypothetical protein
MGKMRLTNQLTLAGALVLATAVPGQRVLAQAVPAAIQEQSSHPKSPPSPSAFPAPKSLPAENPDPRLSLPPTQAPQATPSLFELTDYDNKFSLGSLMKTLRDSRHEGWVLAAYPDPKTSRPLIGAGFSLDVEAREHIQSDPLNPHTFIEPSSAQLWQAAGLDPERLQKILDQYDRDLKAWKKKNYRKKIKAHKLPPQVTEEEATSLLRVSAIQAVHNAQAYCRGYDRLTASQQMALSQLVYQMGVNLEEFVDFLTAINSYFPDSKKNPEIEKVDWKAAQRSLIESDWARRYSNRAIAVIAMFNPSYNSRPRQALRQVHDWIYPPPAHPQRNARNKKARTELARNSSRKPASKRRAKQG